MTNVNENIYEKRSCNPEDWLRWLQQLEEADSDGALEISDESDTEVDGLQQSDHDTASEQGISGSENEQGSEDDPDNNNNSDYYFGKDKTTKWRKTKPPQNVRTQSHNIITHLPGLKNKAKDVTTEIEAINLFLDDLIPVITKYTNIYIEKKQKCKYQRERDAKLTDEIEIRALIGLLFLIGAFRCSRKHIHQFWDNSKGNGIESCYLTISEKRFYFLLRSIRFDNFIDRDSRKEIDKLAAIREVFDITINNFQKYYSPSEYLTIDEQLLAFRGKCSFRQYIPSKPAKYGIKTFALVDCKTAYTINLETYVGQQPEGPYKQGNKAEEIVLRMVKPVEGTNRNITGDNWFTSISLVTKLLKEKKLTYVGTLRKNKREIPKEFLPDKKRNIRTSVFGFQKESTIVSFCPKKNKSVILISSMHHDERIDEESGKPEIITFYNMTKTGVDLIDQLCQKNNVARTTRRWPMVIFYNILNLSAINALCIYKAKNLQNKVERNDFLQKISWELIKAQIQRRSEELHLPKELKRRAKMLLGGPANLADEKVTRNGSRGRCYICGRARNKTTRKWCNVCENWVCNEHLIEVCKDCSAAD